LFGARALDFEALGALPGFIRTRAGVAESAVGAGILGAPCLSCSTENDLGLPFSSFVEEVPAKIFVHPIDLVDFWECTLASSPVGFFTVLLTPPMK
jgi:hypothetical protein